MPEISRFHGIIIKMFHLDHAPPHLHAEFGEYEITVELETSTVHGEFPKRSLGRVQRWIELHRAELLDIWTLARNKQPLPSVPPLE